MKIPVLFLAAVAAVGCAEPNVQAALRLTDAAAVTIAVPPNESGVRLAAEDLARDFEWVLGRRAAIADGAAGTIIVRIDPAVQGPERYRIQIAEDRVAISGSDALGAIFGIYRFSQEFLGVDPYWFWKDVRPARRKEIVLEPRTIESKPSTFRYRGWFVNDEDLLTEWKDGGGKRFLDYPFYQVVVVPEVADRVFETLLRAGGNLVIPASFVDVMNPPEAALVERAVARGLYVTQHHIEPLGVSHFAFETYWAKQGEKAAFSYVKDPDRVRKTWAVYAKKWREIAGDRIIWQLGLRGRGDQPAWASDKGVTQADAGKIISRALADEMGIVRSVDPRPQPPATLTLWAEGSALMSQGAIDVPKGVTIVFADKGASQMLQADFGSTPRTADHTYGVYYHIAYWMNGPHLVQGARPAKIWRNFGALIAKGDTHYAVINVSNVREHLLGVEAATSIMRSHGEWTEDAFWKAWSPPALRPLYQEFLASFVDLGGDALLQDGTCYGAAKRLVDMLAAGRKGLAADFKPRPEALAQAVARLDRVIAEFPKVELPPETREFYTVNLLVQAEMLRGMYEYLRQLELALDDRSRLPVAVAALEGVLKSRQRAEQGQWANWYRGDKKENLRALLERTRALKQ